MLFDDTLESVEIKTLPFASDETDTTLDLLTLRVIELSRHDHNRSIGSPRRAKLLMARLFGIEQPTPLADPRLEAVRRFCILARHGEGRGGALKGALADVGYSDAQRRAIEIRLLAEPARIRR